MRPSYVEPLAERVSEVATHRKCIDGDDATVNSVLRTQLASQPPHSNAGAGRAAACAPLRSGVVSVYLHSPATSTVLPAVLPQSSSPHDIAHPSHLALCCATNATTLPQMPQLCRRVWRIDLGACPRHCLHCLWLWRPICQPAPRVLHHHTQRVLLQRGPVPQCRARAVSVQAAPQL